MGQFIFLSPCPNSTKITANTFQNWSEKSTGRTMPPCMVSEVTGEMAGSGKTILVTGGAGYVGSHCCVELLKEDYSVIVVDNFVNSIKGAVYPESILRVQELTGKTVTFFEADIANKDSLRQVFAKSHTGGQRIDCVIHFAALKAVGESCAQPLKYFMEEIIKDVSAADQEWGCTLLRYFNPVGAHPSGRIGEDPQGVPNNLMPYVAQVAVGRREKLSVYGGDFDTEDGTGCRDYIHIMDITKGHVAALKQIVEPTFTGVKIYNLGTGTGVTVLQIVKACEEATGKHIPYEIVDRRPGDVASCYASSTLAERELGFKAEKSLEDMCRDMWTWQSKNPHGFSTPDKS